MNNIGETNKLDRLGRLGVIGMRGCEEITCRVNRSEEHTSELQSHA